MIKKKKSLDRDVKSKLFSFNCIILSLIVNSLIDILVINILM